MPQSGELNHDFGVYRSLCCGVEIAINADATFPDCPNHPNLTTVWKLVAEKKGVTPITNPSPLGPSSEVHIANRRLFDFAAGKLRLEPLEEDHLHRCTICAGVLSVLLNQPISDAGVMDKPEDAA